MVSLKKFEMDNLPKTCFINDLKGYQVLHNVWTNWQNGLSVKVSLKKIFNYDLTLINTAMVCIFKKLMKTMTLKIYEMMGIREPFIQYHVGFGNVTLCRQFA